MDYTRELEISEEMARLNEAEIQMFIEYMDDEASITPRQDAACIKHVAHIINGLKLPF
jgi:uncharacterized protein YcaQ